MAITCPTCGRANDDDAGYCAGCGTGLPKRCASCGASLAPTAVFCQGCGSQVGTGGTRPAPPPYTPRRVEDTQIEPRPGRAGSAAGGAAASGAAAGGEPRSDPPPGSTPRRPSPGDAYAPPPVPPGPGARQAPPYGGPPSSGGAGTPRAPYGGASQGPPPVVPPPPTPSTPGGGARKGFPIWLIVLIVVALVAVAAAVALVVLRPGGEDGEKHTSASPSASASASPKQSASASPSPSPSTSPSAAAGFPMAATTGSKGNVLSTVSADGKVTRLSAPLGAQVYQVRWSPDGRRLACVAGAWDAAKLWLADVEAGSVSEVRISSPAVVSVDSVAWLSSTELLVAGYTVPPNFQGEVAELLLYDAETGEVGGPLQDGSGASLRGLSVSSSADGGRVAYVTYTDQKANAYDMWTATERLELLDRGAGTVTKLGSGKAYFDINARRFDEPLISPDGQAVIFRQAGSDVGTSYTVVDANGTTVMRSKELTFPAGYAWDPTGQRVVFTGHPADSGGGKDDYVVFYVWDMSAGGKPQRLVSYKKTMVQELSWSPDGTTIAFAEWDRKDWKTGTVYQLSASGGDAHSLVQKALSPAYRPSGTSP